MKTRTSSLPFYYFDKVQVLVDGVFVKAIFYFISTHFQKNETPNSSYLVIEKDLDLEPSPENQAKYFLKVVSITIFIR